MVVEESVKKAAIFIFVAPHRAALGIIKVCSPTISFL